MIKYDDAGVDIRLESRKSLVSASMRRAEFLGWACPATRLKIGVTARTVAVGHLDVRDASGWKPS
jgi:hypothetical protein